jgi:hypothetical protein
MTTQTYSHESGRRRQDTGGCTDFANRSRRVREPSAGRRGDIAETTRIDDSDSDYVSCFRPLLARVAAAQAMIAARR